MVHFVANLDAMLIHTLGLYWRAENVYWGAGSNAGKLLGVPATALTSTPIDFRDQVGFYALYNDYKLVYVGQVGSGNNTLLGRLKAHQKYNLRGRWNQFSWFGLRHVLMSGKLSNVNTQAHPSLNVVLDHIEAVLIEVAEPYMNGQGGRFGSGVKWYNQIRDPRLGLTNHEMLKELCEKAGISLR
jgi:hypothetical protein